mgnify:CR=1 FL=1
MNKLRERIQSSIKNNITIDQAVYVSLLLITVFFADQMFESFRNHFLINNGFAIPISGKVAQLVLIAFITLLYPIYKISKREHLFLSKVSTLGLFVTSFSLLLLNFQMLIQYADGIPNELFSYIFFAFITLTTIMASHTLYMSCIIKNFVEISNRIYTLKVAVCLSSISLVAFKNDSLTVVVSLFDGIPFLYVFMCIIFPIFFIFDERLSYETERMTKEELRKLPKRLSSVV